MAKPAILAVQHVKAEPPGLIADAIEANAARISVCSVFAGQEVPTEIGAHAGLVVMGGPMGVYEADVHPHLAAEARLIESALAAHVPILGVCLGSQLLASVLGARVAPGPRKEIGWFPVTLAPGATQDPLFGNLPTTFTPLHWHGDVFDLPSGAASLASSELTAHQAFVYGESAYGLLFHVEVTPAQVDAMADAFADELAGAGVDPASLRAGLSAHAQAAQEVGRTLFNRWMDRVRLRQAN